MSEPRRGRERDGHRKRLREKFLRAGDKAFFDYELLELFLSYAIPRRDVKPLAKRLLTRFKTLGGLLDTTPAELMAEEGVGESAAILIKLIRRTRGLVSLDLSNYGLKSLHGLSGMPLISLNCSCNRLTSLRELQGMQLESLDCSNNRLSSIKETAKMPLRYFNCSNNPLRKSQAHPKTKKNPKKK